MKKTTEFCYILLSEKGFFFFSVFSLRFGNGARLGECEGGGKKKRKQKRSKIRELLRQTVLPERLLEIPIFKPIPNAKKYYFLKWYDTSDLFILKSTISWLFCAFAEILVFSRTKEEERRQNLTTSLNFLGQISAEIIFLFICLSSKLLKLLLK